MSRTIRWLASAGLLVGASRAEALQFQLFPFDRELSEFVQFYHLKPAPGTAIDRFFSLDLDAFEAEAMRADQSHLGAVLMAFFVHVVHQDPDLVIPFARRVVRETTARKAAFAIEIVAYGASRDRAQALDLIAEGLELSEDERTRLQRLEPYPYAELKATNPQTLDVLWACWFAHTDVDYIRAIVEPLNRYAKPKDRWMARLDELSKKRPDPGSKEYEEWVGLVTAKAAFGGITLNALHYPAVRVALQTISQEPGRAGEITNAIFAALRERMSGWWSGNQQSLQLPWAKSAGPFKAKLLLTHDSDAFFENWKKPSDPVVTTMTNSTTRGRRVEAIVIFSGCSPGPDGFCRALADFVIREPDGSVHGRFDDQEVWVNKPPPVPGAIQFGVVTIGFIAEPQDPLGRYVVQATVRDEVRGYTLPLTQELLVEAVPP